MLVVCGGLTEIKQTAKPLVIVADEVQICLDAHNTSIG